MTITRFQSLTDYSDGRHISQFNQYCQNKPVNSENKVDNSIKITLGSSSPYRAQLLQRLQLPFETESPNIDENPLPTEKPLNTALRLACEKAKKISLNRKDSYIIGCDQVLECQGKTLDKPFTNEKARQQLRWASGKTISLYSGICLLSPKINSIQSDVIRARVKLRNLHQKEIDKYLSLEPALDCAGGLKIEGLGISLVKSVECSDPTGIIGLPLIRLSEMLRAEGINI